MDGNILENYTKATREKERRWELFTTVKCVDVFQSVFWHHFNTTNVWNSDPDVGTTRLRHALRIELHRLKRTNRDFSCRERSLDYRQISTALHLTISLCILNGIIL